MQLIKCEVRACAIETADISVSFMEEEVLKCRCIRAFKNATRHGQDHLSPEDYKVAVLELLGYKPSKYELSNVWSACLGVGQEEAGTFMGIDAFVSYMTDRLKRKDQDELIREVFVSLDVYQRGFLTERECLAAFQQVAPQMREEVVKGLFAELDFNGDGKVSYRDFEIMMKSQQQ